MSGARALFLSPQFGEGMTSEAIEESGVKVFMFDWSRGSGAARRFESVPADANEPDDISNAQTRQENGNRHFSKWKSLTILRRPHQCNRISLRGNAFWRSVCGTHHKAGDSCG
jgi:hypothetical protein